MDKVIITAAVTGAFLSKEDFSAMPVTPDEIVDEIKRCYDAGAAIAHIHARHPDITRTDYDVLGEIVEKVKADCPIITQLGTGVRDRFGTIRTIEDRLEFFNVTPRPDMLTINCGSFHFRVRSKKGPMGSARSYLYNNPPELIQSFAEGCIERRLGIEFECFDGGQIENVKHLMELGVIPENHLLSFNFVLGIGGGMPATPEALRYMVNAVPQGAHWGAMGISKYQAPITTMALTLGGSVRVGFEDNIYLYKGVTADSNARFVERVAYISREIGRELATPEEAKAILHL